MSHTVVKMMNIGFIRKHSCTRRLEGLLLMCKKVRRYRFRRGMWPAFKWTVLGLFPLWIHDTLNILECFVSLNWILIHEVAYLHFFEQKKEFSIWYNSTSLAVFFFNRSSVWVIILICLIEAEYNVEFSLASAKCFHTE